MSDEIRHEMTGLLAAQVDSYAEAIEQRDLARSVACGLEGELHALEIERDALIAQLHEAERRIDNARAVAQTASSFRLISKLYDALDGKP